MKVDKLFPLILVLAVSITAFAATTSAAGIQEIPPADGNAQFIPTTGFEANYEFIPVVPNATEAPSTGGRAITVYGSDGSGTTTYSISGTDMPNQTSGIIFVNSAKTLDIREGK